jgi:predicted MFS family arabinose efflux permease
MFLLLAACMIPFAFMTSIASTAGVLAMFFWCMFVTGGFQMLGLRTGARTYPGERTASVAGVASGAWAAEAAVILPLTGRWFDQAHYNWIFWAVALVPMAGVLIWIALSRPHRGPAALPV